MDLNFFKDRTGKRWFYVQYNNQIIAVALLSQLTHRGWLLKFLIAAPESPRGTTEFLVSSIFQKLRSESCHFLTCGIVPAESLGEIIGLGKASAWLVRFLFKVTKKIFKLNWRKFYWLKFHPKTEPCYLLFSNPKMSINDIRAVLKALKYEF